MSECAHEIPLARRVEKVRAAIAKCEDAQEQWRAGESPGIYLIQAEREFGESWPDVKAILEAYFV